MENNIANNIQGYSQILEEVCNLFILLLNDSNSIVLQATLSSLSSFSSSLGTLKRQFLEEVFAKCQNPKFYRQLMFNFENNILTNQNFPFGEQNIHYFQHECMHWSNFLEPSCKKYKNDIVDVNLILTSIKSNIESLKKVHKNTLTEQNIKDLSYIINQLQMLK